MKFPGTYPQRMCQRATIVVTSVLFQYKCQVIKQIPDAGTVDISNDFKLLMFTVIINISTGCRSNGNGCCLLTYCETTLQPNIILIALRIDFQKIIA